ncbi:MAG: sigma 54-interacting transcriptional regulator [Gammaproteobacteria bacterium]|jgi:PAS domain S-box-containing protein|nr:sigma 54-interacting transcriptional regulator [Gammaproteobacteria bacterium]MDP6617058.1 sigma 54-interacting transcriptional regulator [Gammaproteobacteria bacterium]MDP6695950.1 sigma 54-interacting transcriptional regulator [Gammaproteobacteria bacterium]
MATNDPHTKFLHQLPVMTALLDEGGHFVDVSEEWSFRMGFSRDEMRGRNTEEFATPETVRHIVEEYLPGYERTGKLDYVPLGLIAKDGEIVELLMKARKFYDDAGKFLYSIAVFFRADRLARAERRYDDLYHATPAMLHTVDAEGLITDVSDHWLEKLGYMREEVIGRSILDFLSKESGEELGEGLREIIESGDSKNVPRQMVTQSGDVLDVVMSAHSEIDTTRGVRRLLVATKDMTERNRGEAKLREAYGEIARLKEELERERDYLREEVSVSMNFGRIVGESPALAAMLARIEAVAETPANVLIVGETGTGKELVAHAIHSRSRRADAPLVKVNCASIPHELFESEFFGHVKGAFTGAYKDRVGRFQLADGGTLFLDEVGEIPLALQGKLLRVLQEKEFERVGEDTTRRVDVRVIAATNRDLEKEVEAGNFREDLFYRLSVFPVQAPPLRRRGDDVIQLAVHFLEQVCREFGRPVPAFTQSQVDAMRNYDWPGNIRELKNVIERAVILSQGDTLRLDLSMPGGASTEKAGSSGPAVGTKVERGERNFYTEKELKLQQRDNLIRALDYTNWRISGKDGAAELLGLKPSTLADRIRSYGLEKPAASRRRPAS